MDSQWLLTIIVVAASIVRGETCSDALYCMHHIDGVRHDIQQQDMPSVCGKTMKLIMCVEAAMKDCRVNGVEIPQDNMVLLSNSIAQAKSIYSGYCQDVTPGPDAERQVVEGQAYREVPKQASCSEISLCIMDVAAYTDAVSNSRSHDACRLISPSVECLQSAIQDCTRTGQVSDVALSTFKRSLADSTSKLRQFCVDENIKAVVYNEGDEGSANVLKAEKTFTVIGLMTSLFVCLRIAL